MIIFNFLSTKSVIFIFLDINLEPSDSEKEGEDDSESSDSCKDVSDEIDQLLEIDPDENDMLIDSIEEEKVKNLTTNVFEISTSMKVNDDVIYLDELEAFTESRPLVVDPKVMGVDQQEPVQVSKLPTADIKNNRYKIRQVYKPVDMVTSDCSRNAHWSQIDQFFIDAPVDEDIRNSLPFFEKVVYLGGKRLIRRYPLDLLNQANVTFDAKCVGFSYEAKTEKEKSNYYIPITAIPLDKDVRPKMIVREMNGNFMVEIIAYWEVQYMTPVAENARQNFNPDIMAVTDLKRILANENEGNPLWHLKEILDVYVNYGKNMSLKNRLDSLEAPDLTFHASKNLIDAFTPPIDILGTHWSNERKLTLVKGQWVAENDDEYQMRFRENSEGSRSENSDYSSHKSESPKRKLNGPIHDEISSFQSNTPSQSDSNDKAEELECQFEEKHQKMSKSARRRKNRQKKWNLFNDVDYREYLDYQKGIQKQKEREKVMFEMERVQDERRKQNKLLHKHRLSSYEKELEINEFDPVQWNTDVWQSPSWKREPYMTDENGKMRKLKFHPSEHRYK